jgi:hypothetical protein
MQHTDIAKAAAIAASVNVGVQTWSKTPVRAAANRLPDCVKKQTMQFAVERE